MVVGSVSCRNSPVSCDDNNTTSDSSQALVLQYSESEVIVRLRSDLVRYNIAMWPTSSSSSSGSAPVAALVSSGSGLCRICRRYVEVIGKLRSMSRLLSSLARFSAVTGRMVTPALPEPEAGSGVPWWQGPAAISSPEPEPRLPWDTELTPEPRPECPPHLEAVIILMLGHGGKLLWSIVDQKFIPINQLDDFGPCRVLLLLLQRPPETGGQGVLLPSHCCGPRPTVGLGQTRGCGWGRDQGGLVEQGTIWRE